MSELRALRWLFSGAVALAWLSALGLVLAYVGGLQYARRERADAWRE